MTAYLPTRQGGLPAQPNIVAASGSIPQSPDPNPLLKVSDYQRITGDTTSASADIAEAINDALNLSAEALDRTWLYGQYTENLYLYKNGMVFPSACPIDVGQAIVAGSEVFDPDQNIASVTSVVQGAGVWVGWFTPLPTLPVWSGVVAPQTEITYWGGFVQAMVPAGLKRIWARIAWHVRHPVVMEGQPNGAKATSVQGVSISGDLSSMTVMDPQLRRDLRRWRRPEVRAWQS